MSNFFDRYYRRYDTWYDRNEFAYLSELEAIKKVMPKKGIDLEIGVGTGRFAVPLGIKYGIDPSKRMLELARKRGLNIRRGYGEKLPFRNARFGCVALIITLCFVEDPIKVLKEARRVLKRDGKIIIAFIDKDNFLGRLYQRKGSVFYRNANFYRVKEVNEMLQLVGFKNFSYCQTVFSYPDKMNTIQNPLTGYGRGGFIVVKACKSGTPDTKIHKKFREHERIRFLFKRYGYDMDGARRKVLERAGKIKEPILDVGTGVGRMACTIAQAGFRLRTIDISDEVQKIARIYARKNRVMNKVKFVKMDAHDVGFKDNSFDTVFSANLLHETKRPEKVIDEMIRVCKAGGKIIISDLNKIGRDLINNIYRIDKRVHQSKIVNLNKVVGGKFKACGIPFNKYTDDFVTTFVGRKIR